MVDEVESHTVLACLSGHHHVVGALPPEPNPHVRLPNAQTGECRECGDTTTGWYGKTFLCESCRGNRCRSCGKIGPGHHPSCYYHPDNPKGHRVRGLKPQGKRRRLSAAGSRS